MYKNFYQMQAEAFISLPLPDVFFKSKTHNVGWRYLVYGIKSQEPFLLVTGDYGMGKTLLCLKLAKVLKEKDIYPFVYISTPNYSYTKIVREIVLKLGLEIQKEDEFSLQSLLYEYFENEKYPKPVYIILDDAQEYDSLTLNKLRLLACFNHYGVFPIRLIFFAHSSFLDRLKSPSLRPFDQRIKRRCHLIPFNLLEIKEYIYFRLLNSGAKGSPYFPEDVIEQIFYYSEGIPRLINNACDACLLIGASRELNEIDGSVVAEALESLGWRYEKEDEQAALSFKEREARNTGVGLTREKTENLDHQGSDFTNIGSTGFREYETAALSSQAHKGSSFLKRKKLQIMVFILMLIGAFVLWFFLQKGMLGVSERFTVGENKAKEYFRIYGALGGEKESLQEDRKGAYTRTTPPEKNSSQPYSLILALCRYRKSALKVLADFKNDGLSTLTPCKIDLGKSGEWWVVYMGHFKSQEEAGKVREELQLFDATIKKTPYANLIGVFSSNTEMKDMCQLLETLGYFPYAIEMEKGVYRLLVGAHITMKKAEEQNLDLQAVGIKSKVVKR